MLNKRPYFLFHIIGWVAFIGFHFILFPNPDLLIRNGKPTPFLIDQGIMNIAAILFFYLHYYYLIPKFYFERKYALYGISVFTFIIITLLLVIKINALHPSPGDIPTNIHGVPEFSENPLAPPPPVRTHPSLNPKNPADLDFLLIGIYFLKMLLVFLFSIGLKMYSRWKYAEEEKYKAELSFLKAQINPHFLFNTLNGIYVLAIKKADNTAPAIMKLSSIMRYVINEGHNDYVDLSSEIKYIQDYVDLQKMRLAENIKLDLDFQINDGQYKISPLILVPFIENAFKHGINTNKECSIRIRISVEKSVLHLLVENNIFHNSVKEEDKSGIGIKNTKKRLKLLYPGKHELNIENKHGIYRVSLKLNLA